MAENAFTVTLPTVELQAGATMHAGTSALSYVIAIHLAISLLLVHLTAFVLLLHTPSAMGLAAALPIAAGWFGAAIGRTVSMVLDRGKGGEANIIPIWMGTEIALGLAIAAPILQFTG